MVLVKLKDTSVTNIYEEDFAWRGCDTCDYGSSYGVEYEFSFSDGTSHKFELGSMYDSPVSEGDMMKYLLSNIENFKEMTKEEFIENISNVHNVNIDAQIW